MNKQQMIADGAASIADTLEAMQLSTHTERRLSFLAHECLRDVIDNGRSLWWVSGGYISAFELTENTVVFRCKALPHAAIRSIGSVLRRRPDAASGYFGGPATIGTRQIVPKFLVGISDNARI